MCQHSKFLNVMRFLVLKSFLLHNNLHVRCLCPCERFQTMVCKAFPIFRHHSSFFQVNDTRNKWMYSKSMLNISFINIDNCWSNFSLLLEFLMLSVIWESICSSWFLIKKLRICFLLLFKLSLLSLFSYYCKIQRISLSHI